MLRIDDDLTHARTEMDPSNNSMDVGAGAGLQSDDKYNIRDTL